MKNPNKNQKKNQKKNIYMVAAIIAIMCRILVAMDINIIDGGRNKEGGEFQLKFYFFYVLSS